MCGMGHSGSEAKACSVRTPRGNRITVTLTVLVTLALLTTIGGGWVAWSGAVLLLLFVVAKRRCLYAPDRTSGFWHR